MRNTVQALREAEKKTRKDERRFLDESIDDRSPTPESKTEDLTPSPSPSPSPAPEDDSHRATTWHTAPLHAKPPDKSNDDMVLEDFFGTEQLTRLDMFKKQISVENVAMAHQDENAGGKGLPKIPEKGPEDFMAGDKEQTFAELFSGSTSSQPPVKLRLAKNCVSDANRISYDVASEMEALRARLQQTTKQELEEFDRKYSPKLHHSVAAELEGGNNHSRQGSLDSSLPQEAATPPLSRLQVGSGHSRQHSLPIDPKFLRQLQQQQQHQNQPNENSHNLVALQKTGWSPLSKSATSVEREGRSPTPPMLHGHIRQVSGGSMSSEGGTFSPPLTPNSPLTPQEGHFQVQHQQYPQYTHPQASSSSSVRPPKGGGMIPPSQQFKQNSKPPGMARIPSDSKSSKFSDYNRHQSGSSNSLNRSSPEGVEGQGQVNGNRSRTSSNTSQTHYSTAVVKRGGSKRGGSKRGSLEIIPPPSMPHPPQQPQGMVVMGVVNTGGMGGKGAYRYDERVPNGRPKAYEQPKRRSYGEHGGADMEVQNFARASSAGGMGVGVGMRFAQLSPPRIENYHASPKLSRLPDRRSTVSAADNRQNVSASNNPLALTKLQVRSGETANTRRVGSSQEDIEPYMTSSHIKSQIQNLNFSYTPFSQTQGAPRDGSRANTVVAADAPRMGKQPAGRGSVNTWI